MVVSDYKLVLTSNCLIIRFLCIIVAIVAARFLSINNLIVVATVHRFNHILVDLDNY